MTSQCPNCKGPKHPTSRVCRTCDLSSRAGVHRIGGARTRICPRCTGPMNRASTMCWDCAIETRSERHKHNTGPKREPMSAKVVRLSEKRGECVVWTGATHNGYGQIGIGRKTEFAHRAAYEAFVGPIPHGMTVDHLCANTLCVNPFHLDTCTRSENSRRAAARRKALKEAS